MQHIADFHRDFEARFKVWRVTTWRSICHIGCRWYTFIPADGACVVLPFQDMLEDFSIKLVATFSRYQSAQNCIVVNEHYYSIVRKNSFWGQESGTPNEDSKCFQFKYDRLFASWIQEGYLVFRNNLGEEGQYLTTYHIGPAAHHLCRPRHSPGRHQYTGGRFCRGWPGLFEVHQVWCGS